MPSMRQPRPISAARPMTVGPCCVPGMTTAAIPADRPTALQRLLEDIRAGKIDIIVVYKVDRLTRSLADFAKLVELFGCR
jgi:Resolvase, N terminal domain